MGLYVKKRRTQSANYNQVAGLIRNDARAYCIACNNSGDSSLASGDVGMTGGVIIEHIPPTKFDEIINIL